MRFLRFGWAYTILAGLLACTPTAKAEICTPRAFAGAFAGEETLCQNWDTDEQQTFWFLSQGSQIIPYGWFLSLEQVNNEKLFRDPAHMDAFRYLPQRPSGRNPETLNRR